MPPLPDALDALRLLIPETFQAEFQPKSRIWEVRIAEGEKFATMLYDEEKQIVRFHPKHKALTNSYHEKSVPPVAAAGFLALAPQLARMSAELPAKSDLVWADVKKGTLTQVEWRTGEGNVRYRMGAAHCSIQNWESYKYYPRNNPGGVEGSTHLGIDIPVEGIGQATRFAQKQGPIYAWAQRFTEWCGQVKTEYTANRADLRFAAEVSLDETIRLHVYEFNQEGKGAWLAFAQERKGQEPPIVLVKAGSTAVKDFQLWLNRAGNPLLELFPDFRGRARHIQLGEQACEESPVEIDVDLI